MKHSLVSLVDRHEQEWTNQVAYMSVLLWQCYLASVLMDYVNAGKLYSAQLFRSAVDCRPIYCLERTDHWEQSCRLQTEVRIRANCWNAVCCPNTQQIQVTSNKGKLLECCLLS